MVTVCVSLCISGSISTFTTKPPSFLLRLCRYDWGWNNASLSTAVGTDRTALAHFTRLSTAPLLPASTSISSGTSGGSSSSTSTDSKGGTRVPVRLGWGQYGEDRSIYQSEHFTGPVTKALPASATCSDEKGVRLSDSGAPIPPASASASAATLSTAAVVNGPGPRTMHLGVDLGAPPGTAVRAPLSGRIHSFRRNVAELDYGPAVVVKHTIHVQWRGGDAGGLPAPTSDSGTTSTTAATFYTLYGHLELDSIATSDGAQRWGVGDVIAAGDVIGWVGSDSVNGGWPPHLHFQVNTELDSGGWRGDYPGVCALADWPAYRLLCPDPNLLLRCPHVAPVGWGEGTGGRVTRAWVE